ncbi:MAG TPA: BRO family protein [Bryobacteraceae bacterium]|nr:BRO family protein [Bryobacteraceae bacterium]HXJ38721.1 BRO family protein [Bryobacteraceae bacterium]
MTDPFDAVFEVISSDVMSEVIGIVGPGPEFERIGVANGGFWYARQFMTLLGYENYNNFQKPIGRAINTFTTLEIPISDGFIQTERLIDGVPCSDYKLTRFACYLIAMNGDTHKQEVAAAQLYFASIAEAIRQIHSNSENVARVQIRDDLSQKERTLSGVAKAAGVISERYGLFHNSGYRGMYDMDYGRLCERKGIPSGRTLLDFMGKQEMAANLFRLTETEAKIKNDGIRGQQSLERAAHSVGAMVRRTMLNASGAAPENLPIAEDIKKVRTKLKKAGRELTKIDITKAPKLSD